MAKRKKIAAGDPTEDARRKLEELAAMAQTSREEAPSVDDGPETSPEASQTRGRARKEAAPLQVERMGISYLVPVYFKFALDDIKDYQRKKHRGNAAWRKRKISVQAEMDEILAANFAARKAELEEAKVWNKDLEELVEHILKLRP